MKIWHRGKLAGEHGEFLEEQAIQINRIVSEADRGGVLFYEFLIEEAHPAWSEVKRRLGDSHTYIGTEFSKDDVAQAEWSMGYASHSIGSFVPEGKWWCDLYYGDRCTACGAGWRQIAPFRVKKEPKLGKHVFADFGSAFELFCSPVVVETFEAHGILGYETQPLLLNKEVRPTESLRQLVVSTIAQPAIAPDLVEHERYRQTDCLGCGRTWHTHYTRGALPLRRTALNSNMDLQVTNEWFGNGRTARREILFSRRVVALVLANRWLGIEFIPIRVV